MEQIINELQKLSKQVTDLKQQLKESENSRYFDNWIPRKKLMEFFDYGDTQIAALLNKANLEVAEVGNRKFIKKESVIRFLEKNIR